MTNVNFALPDITLVLDLEGVIRKAALSRAFSGEAVDGWLGLPWAETVGAIESDRVRRMVEDARQMGASSLHEVSQRFPSGRELPVEYTTVRLGGNAGLIAIGRNLQAVAELQSDVIATQQAIEHDYWKLREVETRYRLLFDMSEEPIVLIRSDNLSIVELNPAATRALGLPPGSDLLTEHLPLERAPFEAMLRRVQDHGNAPGITIRLGADRQRWHIRASLVGSEPGAILLRLGPAEVLSSQPHSAAELFEGLSDGFVVLDEDGTILRANRHFRDMVEAASDDTLVGESLGRWLTLPDTDTGALLGRLYRDGAVRRLATAIRTKSGHEIEVEISAAGNLSAAPQFIGLLLSRRPSGIARKGAYDEALPVVNPTDKASQRKLLQHAIAEVERQCAEAARVQARIDGNAADEPVQPKGKRPHNRLH
jgi:transcriptional regulator PpsR